MSDCHHFVAYLRALPSGYLKRNHALSLSLLISMTQFTLTCFVQSFFNSPGTEQLVTLLVGTSSRCSG